MCIKLQNLKIYVKDEWKIRWDIDVGVDWWEEV